MESFGLFLSIALNYCLIFDLFIMIRYPFSDKSKYMTLYQWGSVIAATIISVVFVVQFRIEETSYSSDWIIQFMFIFQFLVGIYSIYKANVVLNKPGISGSARKLILRRHTTSIVVFFVCNLYIFIFTVYICYKLPLDVTTTPWWQIALKALYLS